jgi:hypothetical protein
MVQPVILPFLSKEGELDLGTGPIEVQFDSRALQAHADATVKLQPRFRLSLRAQFNDVAAFSLGIDAKRVTIRFRNFDQADAIVIDTSFSSEGVSKIEFLPSPQRLAFREGHKLSTITFGVLNFSPFMGPEDFFFTEPSSTSSSYASRRRLGRAVLIGNVWKFEIQELPDTDKRISRLTAQGGFDVTHAVRLTRVDNSEFDIVEAEQQIQRLYLFLSFARGAWTPTIISTGYDANGRKIYEDWGVRIGTPWESTQGWFDLHHSEALGELYPGFDRLTQTQGIGKATSNALYWYLRSNRGGEGSGIDSGIILSLAALERLASAFLPTDFQDEPLASRIRETLSRLDIPVAIPDALENLGVGKGFWRDGPEALTKIRNELVHPNKRITDSIGKFIPDAWQLGQWYIELIVLRLCDYSGNYSNRLKARWVGEVERVPWAG